MPFRSIIAPTAEAVSSLGREGWHSVIFVRGWKMRNKAAVFDEFAAALQFPCYFGENWDAFEECLRDIAIDVPDGPGRLVILKSEELLAESSERDWETFFAICGALPAETEFQIVFHSVVPNSKIETSLKQLMAGDP